MYVPAHFRSDDLAEQFAFIERHAFGMLVSVADGAPFVSHLPFLVERARAGDAGLGTLRGHVARANPHWHAFSDAEATVVFRGPHGYVSPAWYEGVENVPTWNYTAVHAYGVPRIVTEPGAVIAMLRALVDENERAVASAWTVDALPEPYLQRMIGGIVAFEVPIARLEAKAKVSQNRPAADRSRVAAKFAASPDPELREMAELVRAGALTPRG